MTPDTLDSTNDVTRQYDVAHPLWPARMRTVDHVTPGPIDESLQCIVADDVNL